MCNITNFRVTFPLKLVSVLCALFSHLITLAIDVFLCNERYTGTSIQKTDDFSVHLIQEDPYKGYWLPAFSRLAQHQIHPELKNS
jgi:hypothetical protein